jgi:hypothetical protein
MRPPTIATTRADRAHELRQRRIAIDPRVRACFEHRDHAVVIRLLDHRHDRTALACFAQPLDPRDGLPRRAGIEHDHIRAAAQLGDRVVGERRCFEHRDAGQLERRAHCVGGEVIRRQHGDVQAVIQTITHQASPAAARARPLRCAAPRRACGRCSERDS